MKLKKVKNCTGCMACVNICKQNAIFMVEKDKFYIPEIDKEKCINCGLCEKVCKNNKKIILKEPQREYIAVSKDYELSKLSSSGGIFITVAKYFIESLNGVVFGCIFDENLKAVHSYGETLNSIKKMQGSKYVQSCIGDNYKIAKQFLIEGKYVLFSGTPCQIGGLYRYLGKDYNKLITMDIVCHGVASPVFFKRYLSEMNNKILGKVREYSFRKKNNNGKSEFIATRKYKFFKIERSHLYDAYFRLYLLGKIFRESCYECEYASSKRVSDITIGDCDSWREYPFFYKEKATSILLLNSKKATNFWKNNLNGLFEFSGLNLEKEKARNNQLEKPFFREDERSYIFDKLDSYNWKEIQKLYAPINFIEKIKFLARIIIPKSILEKVNSLRRRRKLNG